MYSKIIDPISGKLINVTDYEGYNLLNKYLYALSSVSKNNAILLEEIKKVNAVVVIIQDSKYLYLVCNRFGRGTRKKWIAVPGTLEIISETIEKKKK